MEKFIGQMAYQPLLMKSGGEIFEDDLKYGRYAVLLRETGMELIKKCPRKDLKFEFKLVRAE